MNKKLGDVVICHPIEVSNKECNGDTTKMIKRFTKKIRKEEVLKPFYGNLLYFETKSQKRRRKKLKSVYEHKRQKQKNIDIDEKKY